MLYSFPSITAFCPALISSLIGIMAVIYDNKVKGLGACVAEFEGMFILFGDNAPDTLKDYCYTIDVN